MKIKFQDREVEANEIQVLSSSEPWNEYQLVNGKILKIKFVAMAIYEAVSEKLPDGTPLYIITSQNIVRLVK